MISRENILRNHLTSEEDFHMQKITIEPVTRIEGHAKVTSTSITRESRALFHVNEWRGLKNFPKAGPFFE